MSSFIAMRGKDLGDILRPVKDKIIDAFKIKTDIFSFRIFQNEGHMNIWGSNKVSTHFGKFLKENYDLVDHRNDEKYANWNEDYAKYVQAEAAAK